MPAIRRLAAILAADVAGYSRLMGADEEGTHERLKAHRRELVDPKISEHSGRIVKTTGDGMLAEFPSVVDAVRCAADIQRAMIDREAGIPEDGRIRWRIGINLGDVIVEDGDIFGDGVNVAARLEALANRAGSVSRARCATKSATSCPLLSRIWASRASRTSLGRCGSMRCAREPWVSLRHPACRESRCVAGAVPSSRHRRQLWRHWRSAAVHGGSGRPQDLLRPRRSQPPLQSRSRSSHRGCRSSSCRSPISAATPISNILPTASPTI